MKKFIGVIALAASLTFSGMAMASDWAIAVLTLNTSNMDDFKGKMSYAVKTYEAQGWKYEMAFGESGANETVIIFSKRITDYKD